MINFLPASHDVPQHRAFCGEWTRQRGARLTFIGTFHLDPRLGRGAAVGAQPGERAPTAVELLRKELADLRRHLEQVRGRGARDHQVQLVPGELSVHEDQHRPAHTHAHATYLLVATEDVWGDLTSWPPPPPRFNTTPLTALYLLVATEDVWGDLTSWPPPPPRFNTTPLTAPHLLVATEDVWGDLTCWPPSPPRFNTTPLTAPHLLVATKRMSGETWPADLHRPLDSTRRP